MEKQVLLYEYEQILIGNKSGFSPYYFKHGDDTALNYTLYIIKFAVEEYLRWDPFDMKNHFDLKTLKKMKLEPLMRYITFPDELDKEKDLYYLASILYPDVIKIDVKELVLRIYKDVLSGDLCKFPKEYLSGTQGMLRAGICLQYMLNQYYTFQTTKDIYAFFAKPDGMKALKKYRLNNVCNEIYEFPVDFVHESLPDKQKDEFWYHYYRFKALNDKLQKIQKRKELKNKKEGAE